MESASNKNSQKILITTGIFPPDIGGPATQIERLASDLSQNKFKVTVLTYGSPEKKERIFGLVKVSKKWPWGLRQLLFAGKTFWLAAKAHIIYTTDLYSPGFFSMLAAKFWKKKLVVRFAGDSAWETAVNRGLTSDNILTFQEKIYTPFVENLKKRRTKILKSADGVVAVSNFIKNLAGKIGVMPEKIHVIYNAVDFLKEIPQWNEAATATLVFSGRLVPWKGVAMLIKVVAKLKKDFSNIVLEILGDGPELENLKNLCRQLKIEEKIIFQGKISEPETHAIFARVTIFVLNTNYEGLSHAILNALSVGIPVITTSVGGNPEIIKNDENGLLVGYNNEEQWLAGIERLLKDKNLRQKFSQNGKKSLERFKWSQLLEKTVEVLNRL